MKYTVAVLIIMFCSVVSAKTIDRQTNRQLAHTPTSIQEVSPFKYKIEWPGGIYITAVHWPKTGDWSFNVTLKPGRYYQTSYTQDGSKGVLLESTCERIIDILLPITINVEK